MRMHVQAKDNDIYFDVAITNKFNKNKLRFKKFGESHIYRIDLFQVIE